MRPASPTNDLEEARRAIRNLAQRLREVDGQLAKLSKQLPKPSLQYNPHTELHGIVDCVRTDLLDDAITTLEAAASHDEDCLRMRFVIRRMVLDPDALHEVFLKFGGTM